jgi:hypothetical protein
LLGSAGCEALLFPPPPPPHTPLPLPLLRVELTPHPQQAMGLPQMSGNYGASQYLTPYDAATGKGYVTHAVTTGISSRL